ncbi:protein-tyrosine phosphatase [Pseudidiomarina maritima]|uniref:protein-tyrosine-phosphatase n=1 Tax=Pseudidiomarina maritima TaxID=519453 RepID=A0A1I6GRY3_9GAMM|nr:low molecular weight protein-tyrosine-phosphatase [Pseudidiomarina maritima]SFR44940.1 protein-tyrosine phosphatase [Pseudidiomarina maritima]
MFNKILVVCLGNICRSPTAQFLLQHHLPNKTIHSAGITAMVRDGKGHDMDKTAREIAAKNGFEFPKHEAQQLTRELIGHYDLILVMENKNRSHIANRYPEAHAKTMLLGQWLQQSGKEIPDPYKKSEEVYQHVFELINKSCDQWKTKL